MIIVIPLPRSPFFVNVFHWQYSCQLSCEGTLQSSILNLILINVSWLYTTFSVIKTESELSFSLSRAVDLYNGIDYCISIRYIVPSHLAWYVFPYFVYKIQFSLLMSTKGKLEHELTDMRDFMSLYALPCMTFPIVMSYFSLHRYIFERISMKKELAFLCQNIRIFLQHFVGAKKSSILEKRLNLVDGILAASHKTKL